MPISPIACNGGLASCFSLTSIFKIGCSLQETGELQEETNAGRRRSAGFVPHNSRPAQEEMLRLLGIFSVLDLKVCNTRKEGSVCCEKK